MALGIGIEASGEDITDAAMRLREYVLTRPGQGAVSSTLSFMTIHIVPCVATMMASGMPPDTVASMVLQVLDHAMASSVKQAAELKKNLETEEASNESHRQD